MMKTINLTLILSLILIITACDKQTDSATTPTQNTRPIIIDTDMAIDDWTAILYILQHKKAQVLAITITGAGEAYCAEGMRNAMYLLRLTNKQNDNITVACGDSEPLDGYNVFPQAWRDDVNNLYGLPIPDDLPAPSSKHAIDVLIAEITNSETAVDIITLGNLTNIGQLLEKQPDLKHKIHKIYIMGGAINEKGNVIVPGFTDNNKNKVAEWNIYVDPLAAQIVLRADVAKALVPLDATNRVQVTHEFAAQFKQQAKSASAKFIDQILDKNKGFISSGEYYFWDPLTAVYALDESICESQQKYVDVIVKHKEVEHDESSGSNTQGDYSAQRSDGQTRNIMDPYMAGKTIVSESPLGKKVDICLKPDINKFENLLIQGLNTNY